MVFDGFILFGGKRSPKTCLKTIFYRILNWRLSEKAIFLQKRSIAKTNGNCNYQEQTEFFLCIVIDEY